MNVPICSDLKRRKSVGHGLLGARKRTLNTAAPIELQKMKPTSPEVSKSASLSSHQDEEDLDALWDTLPKVDGTAGSTAVGLSPDVIQEEAVQKKESAQEKAAETSSILPTTDVNQPPEMTQSTTPHEDKGKAPVEVNPTYPTVVPELAAQPSTTTPTPPQKINVSRSILDSINQTPDPRIATAYAWVDEDLRRLRGTMMVNTTEETLLYWHLDRISSRRRICKQRRKVREASAYGQQHYRENGELPKLVDTHRKTISTLSMKAKIDPESRAVQELIKVKSAQKSAEKMVTTQSETIKELRAQNQILKEKMEYNKKKRKDMASVLNKYDGRIKVNVVKEFVHSSRFENGLARVIDP
ncbi:hypothetical protein Dimus_028859 [Dionaea muscipula]